MSDFKRLMLSYENYIDNYIMISIFKISDL